MFFLEQSHLQGNVGPNNWQDSLYKVALLLMGIMNILLIVCEGHIILFFCCSVMKVLVGEA